jgi:hypothetical protein
MLGQGEVLGFFLAEAGDGEWIILDEGRTKRPVQSI